MKPIVNIDDLQYIDLAQRSRHAAVGREIGAQKLGYNVTVIAPGKRAFPFHSHRLNEEMFFILEGEGQVRIGRETHPVRRGDFIACVTGGPDKAHQLVNTGSTELKVLAVSTMQQPEVCQYPDSGKLAVFDAAPLRCVSRESDQVGYWDGE